MSLTKIIKENINKYLLQIRNKKFKPLTSELFNDIVEEGFVDEIEEDFNTNVSKNDFSFIKLDLDEKDKKGLISFDSNIINKFNKFDIKLKESQESLTTIDFINYNTGEIFIIKYNVSN